jgi:hypothetical protein
MPTASGTPEIVTLRVYPPVVEQGGGVDLTVEYRAALLIRVRRPDGVHQDFPAADGADTETIHVRQVSGGDFTVTAMNPALATSANPYGESAPRVVPIRTYSLPPLSDLRLPDLNLGIPAVQVDANAVSIGEPALSQLTELAQLRSGIADLPAPFPAWLAEPPATAAFAVPPLIFPLDVLPALLAQMLAAPVSPIVTVFTEER